jgi:hypothetical protein
MYDRLIAAQQAKGTCSFLLLYSDLAGYVGSLLWLMLFSWSEQSAVDFFATMTVRFAGLSVALLAFSAWYFQRTLPRVVSGVAEFELVKSSDEDEMDVGIDTR